jgi:hypothetical protein
MTVGEAEPSDAKELLTTIHKASSESDNLSFGAGEFDMTEADEAEFLFVLEGTLKNELLIRGQYYDLYSMGLYL